MNFFDTLSGIKLGSISLSSLLSAIILFVICYVAIKLLCKLFDKMLCRAKHLDKSLKSFFGSAVKVILWAVAVMIVADSLGISVTSLVAILSVAGVALSLALQGLLANVFSGITILATRPIAVGDFVEISGQSGTVGSIGLFYTTIDTVDNKRIYVPNGDVTASNIVNYSAEETRRVDLTFSASYDCATEAVRNALMAAVNADGRVLQEPAPFIAISSYDASSIQYIVRVWVKSGDYWDVYYALNENVRESFERSGVEMSYEHLNVHIAKD